MRFIPSTPTAGQRNIIGRTSIFVVVVAVLALGALAVSTALAATPENEVAKLTASVPVEDANFGESVAISGDTAIAGAIFDGLAGSAYVFVRDGGAWPLQVKLTPSDLVTESDFGWSVAVDGDTAVIGAPSDGDGSAYVFVQSGGVWTEQAKLVPIEPAPEGQFGMSVSVSGDTAVVGGLFGEFVDPNFQNFGAAYVFVRSGGSWSQQDKVRAVGASFGVEFGISLAVSDDTLVVGAPSDGDGSAYVFVRSGGSWDLQEKLTASDPSEGDEFGCSVALDGDTAVVGAPADGIGKGAYVFVRSGVTWDQQDKLTPSVAV